MTSTQIAASQIAERFNAAVNVIRGLPKNGSYQPSNEMMLKFYAYFKQATLGPCTQKQPAFWEVVNRAKWDSYKALGNMPSERAMELYVEELKKIIETMSYTDNVAQFMGSINELDGVNFDDLETIAPEVMKTARSRPDSPFASREASPVRGSITQQLKPNILQQSQSVNANGLQNALNGQIKMNGHHNHHHHHHNPQNQHHDTLIIPNGNHEINNNHQNGYSTEYSDDEFIDTVEDDTTLIEDIIATNRNSRSTTTTASRRFEHNAVPIVENHLDVNGSILHNHNNHIQTNNNNNNNNNNNSNSNISNQISNRQINNMDLMPTMKQLLLTVQQMENAVQQIYNRIGSVEKTLAELNSSSSATAVVVPPQSQKKIAQLRYPTWWPFADISPNWFILLIVWPFIVRRILRMLNQYHLY